MLIKSQLVHMRYYSMDEAIYLHLIDFPTTSLRAFTKKVLLPDFAHDFHTPFQKYRWIEPPRVVWHLLALLALRVIQRAVLGIYYAIVVLVALAVGEEG